MIPPQYDTQLFRGTTFTRSFLLQTLPCPPGTPINLTGCAITTQMQVERGRKLVTAVPVALTSTIDADPTSGKFVISLTPTQTLGLSLGEYVYSIVLTYSNGIDKKLLLRGEITVTDPLAETEGK